MQTIEMIEPVTAAHVSDPPTQTYALAVTPAQVLAQAVQRGAPLEQIERFMAIKERWEADEARKAFNAAFASFKAEAVKLPRTKEIKSGPLEGKFHVELSGVVAAATPALSRYGLSASWKLTKDEPAWMEVTCTLRHSAGHSESVSMGGAPDTGPDRNAIQARGSVKTYLERYTLTAILGLAASDADDDGDGGAKDKGGLDALLQSLTRQLRETKTDADALAFWNKHKGELVKNQGAYNEFKDQTSAHRVELKEAAK